MKPAPTVPEAKPTAFHPRTSACCTANRWERRSGFATAAVYTDARTEYFAIRNSCALTDVSALVKYDVAGIDAERYLNRLVTPNVRPLEKNRVAYVAWCDDNGMLIDDGTLFRFDAHRFRLCCTAHHLPWLIDSAAGFEVEITDTSETVAALSVQGPTSCAVLQAAGIGAIDSLEPFSFATFTLADSAVVISRTGFTGDLGYEIWLEPGHALDVWDTLIESGRLLGIMPAGLDALELARIEAGFIKAGAEFLPGAHHRSPAELGLDWLVDFEKGHFNGRRALLRERESGGGRFRLAALDIEGDIPAHEAMLYDDRGNEVGWVTSAAWSPTCKRNVALATIRKEFRIERSELRAVFHARRELDTGRMVARCREVERPFFDPPRRRAIPAGRS